MKLVRKLIPKWGMAIVFGSVLHTAEGCRIGPPNQSQETESKPAVNREAQQGDFNPATALYCVETLPQNSTQSFHFSSSRKHLDTGESYSTEAEITPETIDLTKHDISGSETTHWQRSDEGGWARAIHSITKAAPWMQLNAAKPGIKRVGLENVDGFEAIKFAVDTTKEDPLQKSGHLAGSGAKDYNLVGSAWLKSDTGCVLKYDLDYEVDGKDGTVSKTHYEGAIKK